MLSQLDKTVVLHESTMNEICKPLRHHFNDIYIFTFCRYYYTHQLLTLSTKKDPYLYFFDQLKNFIMPFPDNVASKKFHYVISGEGNYSELLHMARSHFGLAGGLNLVEINPDYCDFFAFCLKDNKLSTLNRLLAHLDFLEKFCVYFKEKAQRLLSLNTVNGVCLDNVMQLDLTPIKTLYSNQDEDNFLEEIALDRYSMSANDLNDTVSKTQWLCLQQLGRGLSAKEVASLLGLSHQSVHTYVRDLKEKFSCQTRSELLDLFRRHFPSQ